MNHDTDDYGVTITATAGRDNGKTFRVPEISPIDTTTYVLRLLAAIRVDGVDELVQLLSTARGEPGESEPDATPVLRLLAGCDAAAVRSLIVDALAYMQIAPDPQHPGMFRALRDDDLKEKATLSELLMAFVRVNVMPAG